jgi:hypothetical protein
MVDEVIIMNIETTNLFKIRQLGIEVLSRELGPVAMIRFLQQYEIGTGDYSKDRHHWIDNITIDDIAQKSRIKKSKEED